MVSSKRSLALHSAILIAFFTVSGVMTVAGEEKIGILEWLAAGMISAVIIAVAAPIVRWFPLCSPETAKSDRSAIALIFALIVAAVALEVSVSSVSDFASATIEVMLRRSTGYLPMLLLLVPAYLICRRANGIVKFAPIALFVGLPILLLLFIASFDGAAMQEASSSLTFTLEKLPRAYADSFAFACLVLLCEKKAGAHPSSRAALGAIVGGVAAGGICLQIVSVIGTAFAATIDYPYLASVSAITLGGALTRPDGFGYTLIFLSQIIRLAVAGSAFAAASEPFFGERRLPWILFFLLTGILSIISSTI